MSKMRVWGTLVTRVVLCVVVAVSVSVVQAPKSKQAIRNTAAGEFRNAGVLIADGSDPVPPPPNPIPWPKQAA